MCLGTSTFIDMSVGVHLAYIQYNINTHWDTPCIAEHKKENAVCHRNEKKNSELNYHSIVWKNKAHFAAYLNTFETIGRCALSNQVVVRYS